MLSRILCYYYIICIFVLQYLQQARVYIKVVDWDNWGCDTRDEHVFSVNGINWDNTGAKWAYPFSESNVSHNWIPVKSNEQYFDETGSM